MNRKQRRNRRAQEGSKTKERNNPPTDSAESTGNQQPSVSPAVTTDQQQSTVGRSNESKDSNPETKPPRTITKAWRFITEPKHSNAVVAIFTVLIFVTGAIYAIFAYLQWSAITDSNKIARDTFNAANRPYVGLFGTSVTHIGDNSKGEPFAVDHATTQTNRMAIRVEIKNFGTVPALNCNVTWRVFFGNEEIHGQPPSGSPATVFPTDIVFLSGNVAGDAYRSIMHGEKAMQIEVTTYYEWPGNHERYCSRSKYNPGVNGFENIGACVGKGTHSTK